MLFSSEARSLFATVIAAAQQHGVRAYLVGGVIRELLRGAPATDDDIDLTIEGGAIGLAELLQQQIGGTLTRFEKFGNAKLSGLSGYGKITEIDLSGTRSEQYPAPGSLPVVTPAGLAEDLTRRDFTINALAVALTDAVTLESLATLLQVIISRSSGVSDLEQRLVRILHPRSFLDDPTRLFRAARYAARIGGSIESETAQRAAEALSQGALATISATRIANELRKIFLESAPTEPLRILHQIAVLGAPQILPAVDVEKLLLRLAPFSLEMPSELRIELSWILIADCTPESERETLLRRFGHGKQLIKRCARLFAPSTAAPSHLLSVEEQCLAALLAAARGSGSLETGQQLLAQLSLTSKNG